MKKNMKLEDLCKDLPKEIIDYMKYANSLKFEQKPDYKIIKICFENILIKNGIIFDKYIFSWCGKEKLSLSKKSYTSKTGRRSSSHQRLLREIQKSIEKKNKYNSLQKLGNFELERKRITNNLINSETPNACE